MGAILAGSVMLILRADKMRMPSEWMVRADRSRRAVNEVKKRWMKDEKKDGDLYFKMDGG
jgi:hypothetical protein